MPTYPAFATLLNKHLTVQERSINWLAQKIKHNSSTVDRWITHATRPGKAETVQALLIAFNIHDPSERHAFFSAAGYPDPDQATSVVATADPLSNSVTSFTPPPQDFVAYNQYWVGRQSLVQELSEQIQNSCRLLVVVGMAGIGKTALAERVAVGLEGWLQSAHHPVSRLNFDYQERGRDFVSVAMQWLADWGTQVAPEEQQSPVLLLRRVVQNLRQQRRLIIIDALEKILIGNDEHEQSDLADEWWTQFFHNVLSAEVLQGRIIVTTQDLSVQLVKFAAEYPNRWLLIPLHGLSENEQLAFFQKHGLLTQPDTPEVQILARIGKIYSGHPLALRAIAGEIVQDHFANLLDYWQQFGHEIETVERDLMAAQQNGNLSSANDQWRLDRFSVELQRQVRHRLDGTFARLQQHAPDAYLLICAAAEYRVPVKARFWLGQLAWRGKSEQEQQNALQALRDRSLVEQSLDPQRNRLFALHNLIRSVALEHHGRLFPSLDKGTE